MPPTFLSSSQENRDCDTMCLHFCEVNVLWDGAFSLARTINSADNDADTYQRFVLVALHGSKTLKCPITPKVHMMLKQIKNFPDMSPKIHCNLCIHCYTLGMPDPRPDIRCVQYLPKSTQAMNCCPKSADLVSLHTDKS